MNKLTGEIEEYQFQSFSERKDDNIRVFEFTPLSKMKAESDLLQHQKTIKIERSFASQSQFKISPIVEKHRGLKDQEEYEYEMRVRAEVEKRVLAIQEEAYKSGFNEGVEQGREEIFNEMRNVVDQKLENFSEMINNVLSTQESIVQKQKKEIYGLIKNLTKWIILRELNEDGNYIERLLEKILLDMQARNNLLIQVNSSDFGHMPEILEHIRNRLGELKNTRVEIDSQIKSRGIIVESENGIINATMEEQFRSLDKLFEDVLTVES